MAFTSAATNLVPGSTRRGSVYVHNRATGVTTVVSVRRNGKPGSGQWPSISGSGRFVAFESSARLVPEDTNHTSDVPGDTNGVTDIFVRDLQTRITERVSVSSTDLEADGQSRYPSISAHGAHIAFMSSATDLVPGDQNAQDDCFVRDLSW